MNRREFSTALGALPPLSSLTIGKASAAEPTQAKAKDWHADLSGYDPAGSGWTADRLF
jgi:hypothetical protein